MQNTSKPRFSTQILIPSQNYRPVHPTASLTYPHRRPRVSANSQLPEESSGLLLPQALSFPKLSQFSFTPIIYSSHAISISKTCPICPPLPAHFSLLSVLEQTLLFPASGCWYYQFFPARMQFLLPLQGWLSFLIETSI